MIAYFSVGQYSACLADEQTMWIPLCRHRVGTYPCCPHSRMVQVNYEACTSTVKKLVSQLVRRSVGLSVCRSVGPSVGTSVRPSVRPSAKWSWSNRKFIEPVDQCRSAIPSRCIALHGLLNIFKTSFARLDKSFVASGSQDNTVKIWKIPPKIDDVCDKYFLLWRSSVLYHLFPCLQYFTLTWTFRVHMFAKHFQCYICLSLSLQLDSPIKLSVKLTEKAHDKVCTLHLNKRIWYGKHLAWRRGWKLRILDEDLN